MSLLPTSTLALVSLLLISGCSPHSVDETYSDATSAPCNQAPLRALQLPSDLSLPVEADTYRLPPPPTLTVAAPPDIRPPIQPLALLPGSEAYHQGRQVIHQLTAESDRDALWDQLKQLLIEQQIGLTTESTTCLTTDWITLEDRGDRIKARFRLSLSTGNDPAPQLTGELLASQFLPKTADNLSRPRRSQTTAAACQQRQKLSDYQQRHYTILWVNRLLTKLVVPPQNSDTAHTLGETPAPEGVAQPSIKQ